MSKKESQELHELVKQHKHVSKINKNTAISDDCPEAPSSEPRNRKSRGDLGALVQWTTCDGKKFVASGATRKILPPGVYEIHQNACLGRYFERIPIRTEGLIRFPQTNSEKVLKQIDTFWNKASLFAEFKLPHKRGILLWGPPGGGKTCTVNLIMKDVVEDRRGVVIKFLDPGLFIEGMREFRAIQPETPVVILMEDIDSVLDRGDESIVLNILDGVEVVQKTVFLATTNYPEKLGPRIVNRPSRFDKRFKIGYPNEESRAIYFRHLCGDKSPKSLGVDIERWVRDTENFSIAHLKELFVAVVILGDNYAETLEDLELMKENISSEDDRDKNMNIFAGKSYNPIGCKCE